MNTDPVEILLCVNRRINGNSCSERGSEQLAELINAALAESHPDVVLKKFCCFGMCNWGPNLRIAPGGDFFHQFSEEKIPELMEALTKFKQANVSADDSE
jgi:NADH:ubiquinone oxidoreductase subunit E